MGEEAALTGSARGKSPDRIRADIEQTRAELGATLAVLRERLSPDRIKREMVGKIRNATVGRVRNMMETSAEKAKELGSLVAETAQRNPVSRAILDNPIPAVLAGAGIAWLIWKNAGRSRRRATASAAAGLENAAAEYCGCGGVWREPKAGTAAGRAKEVVDRGKEAAEEAVGQARETAGRVLGQAREKAGRLGTATREKARVLKERSRGLAEEKPLLLAAAALGAGVMIGLALPGTEREREWLGKIRDRLLSGAGGFSEEKYGEGDRPWPSQGQPGDLNL